MKKVINLFNGVLLVLPLGLASFLAMMYMFGGWGVIISDYGPEHFFLPELGHWGYNYMSVTIIFFLAVFIFRLFQKFFLTIKNVKVRTAITVVGFFLIATLIRAAIAYMFREDIKPFSDFSRSWDMAHGILDGNLDYYSLFPSYLNYSVYLRLVVKFLGDAFINVIYLNAVFSGLTASCIFLITMLVFNEDRIALIAGLLYTFLPSNIFYTMTGTPEFITILFNTMGVLGLVVMFKFQGKRKFLIGFVSGVMLGIGTSYKSFAIIILIAFVMSFILFQLESIRAIEKRYRMKIVIASMISMLLIFSGYKIANQLIVTYTEKVYDVQIDTGKSVPHFLLIGLNTEGEGQIHLGTLSRQYITEYMNNGNDSEAAKLYAYELLKADWKQNKSSIASLYLKKLVWAWQDHLIPIRYFNNDVGINVDSVLEEAVFNYSLNILPGTAQLYYFILMALAFIGSKKKLIKKTVYYRVEFFYLIIFGYFCLVLLSEAQSRYKSLILPYVCIISAMGVLEVYKLGMKRLGKNE